MTLLSGIEFTCIIELINISFPLTCTIIIIIIEYLVMSGTI